MGDARDGRGWRAHDAEQLRAWKRLTHGERLAWLWQAKLFAAQALAAAELRRQSGSQVGH